MIGAMLVTVVLILAFVVVRTISRDDFEVEREAIDYLSVVAVIQEGEGMSVAYPQALPEGAKAVEVAFNPATEWKLDTLTDGGRYLGIYQGRVSAKQWAESWIDADAEQGKDVALDSPLGKTWQTWTDQDGDYGVTIEFEETVVMVFGSAGDQEIREMAESLVTSPVAKGATAESD